MRSFPFESDILAAIRWTPVRRQAARLYCTDAEFIELLGEIPAELEPYRFVRTQLEQQPDGRYQKTFTTIVPEHLETVPIPWRLLVFSEKLTSGLPAKIPNGTDARALLASGCISALREGQGRYRAPTEFITCPRVIGASGEIRELEGYVSILRAIRRAVNRRVSYSVLLKSMNGTKEQKQPGMPSAAVAAVERGEIAFHVRAGNPFKKGRSKA